MVKQPSALQKSKNRSQKVHGAVLGDHVEDRLQQRPESGHRGRPLQQHLSDVLRQGVIPASSIYRDKVDIVLKK